MPKRIYSEKEVAQLIRRAVQLEADRSVTNDKGMRAGLSIAELEKVAAESGIDPELIKQAAKEFDENSSSEINIEGKTEINRSEIFCERWINTRLSNSVRDNLITELNHRFGTSEDDINWWDQLWNSYAGKAKIRKTTTSVEWHYTSDMELYTIRVLMQQRGEKFRIRVSKRQAWNISWYSEETHTIMGVITTIILTVIGGVLGFSLLNSGLIGILAGLGLSAIIVPSTILWNKHQLNKHKNEVIDIADHLSQQATQMVEEEAYKQKNSSDRKNKKSDLSVIEIRDDEEEKSSNSGDLRNMLRE
ncbi:MAG: hypothetical protein WEA58_15390 [Balneolaceae bacterium]